MESEFDPATAQPLPKLRKTLFKDPSVEKEYGGVNPDLQKIIDNAPNPVTVTSGFRDPAKNAAVGGVPNSLHQNGDAADIRYDDKWPENKKYFAQNGVNVLEEKDHPHLSYKGKPKTVDDEFDPAMAQPLDSATPDVNKGLYAQPTKMQRFKDFINNPLLTNEMLTSKGNEAGTGQITPEYPQGRPEDVAAVNRGVTTSVKNLASGLTTPKNIAQLAGSAAFPLVGLAAAAPSIPGMLKHGWEGLVAGKKARESGDYEKAGEEYTNAGANGLMGLSLAKGVGGVVGSGLSTAAGANPESLTGKTVGTIGKGLTSLTNTPQPELYNKAINPEVQKIAQEGYPLTSAEIKGGRIGGIAQRLLERAPLSAGIFKKFGEGQSAELNNQVGDFKNEVGMPTNAEVSEGATQGLENTEGAFRAKSKELYDKAQELAGGATGKMPNYADKLQSHLGDETELNAAGLDSESLLKRINKSLKDQTGGEPLASDKTNLADKSFDQMRRMRSALYDLAESSKSAKESIGTRETKVYTDLAKSVENDISDFAANRGNDLMDAYQKANQFYKPGKEDINSDVANKIRTLAKEAPNGLAKALVQPENDFRVQQAKRLLGDQFGVVQKQLIKNLIEDSTVIPKNPTANEVAGTPKGIVQGDLLLKNMENYGQDGSVLKEALTPDQLESLNDLALKSRLSKSAAKASKDAAGRGGANILHTLLTPIGALGAPAAKFMTSPTGARVLSTSLPRPAIGKVALPFNPLTNPLNRGLYKDKQ